ncbi:MAG TPA: hypothetical protein VGH34_20780 [Vicinamibacterales bacterium]|jgi:hypothetical protein
MTTHPRAAVVGSEPVDRKDKAGSKVAIYRPEDERLYRGDKDE